MAEDVPAGLSLFSHLPSQCDDGGGGASAWDCDIEERSDDACNFLARAVCSREYNEAMAAVDNAKSKALFENRLKEFLQQLSVDAQADADMPKSASLDGTLDKRFCNQKNIFLGGSYWKKMPDSKKKTRYLEE